MRAVVCLLLTIGGATGCSPIDPTDLSVFSAADYRHWMHATVAVLDESGDPIGGHLVASVDGSVRGVASSRSSLLTEDPLYDLRIWTNDAADGELVCLMHLDEAQEHVRTLNDTTDFVRMRIMSTHATPLLLERNPMPPSPPPQAPPLAPGATLVYTVTYTATIDATVETFDAIAFATALASHLGVAVDAIELSVSSGSVVVVVTIVVSSQETADDVVAVLEALDDEAVADAVLGVTVIEVTAPVIGETIVHAPSSPRQPPPHVPPSAPPSDSDDYTLLTTIVLCCLVIIAGVGIYGIAEALRDEHRRQ